MKPGWDKYLGHFATLVLCTKLLIHHEINNLIYKHGSSHMPCKTIPFTTFSVYQLNGPIWTYVNTINVQVIKL